MAAHDATQTTNDSARATALALAPVLIVGAPRSGTTWLQRLLLHDPAVCGGQETHWFVHLDGILREARRKRAMPRPHGVLCHLTEAALFDLMRRTWIDVCTPVVAASPEASILVEKTPDHACHLDLATTLLPAARVIHVVRSAEAVIASLLAASRTDWGRPWAPRRAETAAHRWVECVEAAESAADRLGPERFLRVRYESLVERPAAALGRVRRWLGLAADEAEVQAAIKTNARDTLRSGGGTSIPLLGDAAGDPTVEPDGFVGDAAARPLGPIGLSGLFGRLRHRRCRRITQATVRRLDERLRRDAEA